MSTEGATVAEARDLLAELVEIPSPSGSEGRIVDRIEELAEGWSIPALRVRSELGRDSLVLGRAIEPALAIAAHVDTIAAPWPAAARIEGDVVHGLGSADDKGGVVACLLAARDLVADGEDLDRLEVAFAFPVDEERGGSGSRTVALELAPRRAIALEATGLRVGVVETGDIDVWVHVRGRSAHGALTDAGENAIHGAVELIGDLAAARARRALAPAARPLAGRGRGDQGWYRLQHRARQLQLPAPDPGGPGAGRRRYPGRARGARRRARGDGRDRRDDRAVRGGPRTRRWSRRSSG